MNELLVRGGTLVAMDVARTVAPYDVLVRDGSIAWLGRRGRAPRASQGVKRDVLDAGGALVLPGFVQSHVHLCQVLFRGMADDLPLLPWLRERIWPLEANHDADSLRLSAELGVAELLLSGTTTILDMGTTHHHDAVFEALEARGLRARSGKAMMDAPDSPRGLRESTRGSLAESDRLRARWEGKGEGRLSYAYAPRFILSCSEKLLRAVGERVANDGAYAHTHVAEHRAERLAVRERLGQDDLAALTEFGLFGPRVAMAHGVQLSAREIGQVARQGTRLVHCPSSNLKLASGVMDVVSMRRKGVIVGLGADGAPCNNRLDALSELRLALLLAKVRQKNAQALSVLDGLALLTCDGARVLGLEREIGSIEQGKRADLVVVDVEKLHHLPGLDALSTLGYASSGSDVRHVIVDGHVRVRDRELMGVDVARLARDARAAALRVAARAGIAR